MNAEVNSVNASKYLMELSSNCAIVGMIDGILHDPDTNEKVLIETKCRRNRLFTFIPVYEKVQMEVYLRMLGLRRGILNQNFNGTVSTLSYNSDDKLWAQIQTKLEAFCEAVFTPSNPVHKTWIILGFFLFFSLHTAKLLACRASSRRV